MDIVTAVAALTEPFLKKNEAGAGKEMAKEMPRESLKSFIINMLESNSSSLTSCKVAFRFSLVYVSRPGDEL